MRKEHLLYTASLLLLMFGILLYFTNSSNEWALWLSLVFLIGSAVLFITTALRSLSKETAKKYINTYIIFAIIFVCGLPTIFISFVSISIFIGATAHLIAAKLTSLKARAVFYTASLASASAYTIKNIIEYREIWEEIDDKVMFVVFNMLLGAVIMLGLLAAFGIRLIVWFYLRRYGMGKVKGINKYE